MQLQCYIETLKTQLQKARHAMDALSELNRHGCTYPCFNCEEKGWDGQMRVRIGDASYRATILETIASRADINLVASCSVCGSEDSIALSKL